MSFKSTINSFYAKKILRLHENSSQNVVSYVKSLLLLIITSMYTAQLTFTTLCTPYMIFDWFLIVKDCSLIYTTWL